MIAVVEEEVNENNFKAHRHGRINHADAVDDKVYKWFRRGPDCKRWS